MKKTLPYPISEARVHLRDAFSQRFIDIPDSKNRAYGSMEYGETETTFTLKIREERLFVTRSPRRFCRGKLTAAGEETVLETRSVFPFGFWFWIVLTCVWLALSAAILPLGALLIFVIWIPDLVHASEDRADLNRVLQEIFETDETLY